MSKDDLSDLPPIGKNPLDGDLLDAGASAPGESALTSGDPLAIDEGEAISAPSSVPAEEPAAEAESPKETAKPKSPGLAARLAQSNPYTVMLFVSLIALLIGILCLLLEWGAYRFEIKPSAGLAAPSGGMAAATTPPRAAA